MKRSKTTRKRKTSGRKGMQSVLAAAMKVITPSPQEEKEINSALEEVRQAVEKNVGKLGYTFAGSFTRGTWMKDKKEFDVFILFPEFTKRETLERKGLELGKKITSSLKGKLRVAYAEHPYTRASFKGFDLDIVPCYKVADATKLKSAVDRTPFHNQYLSANFHPGMAKEVRLLKQFLKASGLYGSDAKTMGFSGYLCELLILHYKSFRSLVKEASEWEPEKCIDIENHSQVRFPGQSLIVIDPVDPKRNVAAVISPWNFTMFVSLCKAFQEKPTSAFFSLRKPKGNLKGIGKKLSKRGSLFVSIGFKKPDVIEDVLYPQLRRTGNRLVSLLKEYEFQVMGWDVFSSEKECVILLEMETWKLPLVRKLLGPPIFVKKHSKEFLEKYKDARLFVEGERWIAEITRRYPLAEDLLKKTLRRPEQELKETGIASYIAQSIAKGFSISTGSSIMKGGNEFSSFLLEYLEKSI